MTPGISTSRRALAFAVTLALASILILSSATRAKAESEESGSDNGLQGTWRVQVTVYNCDTGVAGPPFKSLLSFARGGTLTGTTTNPGFQPGQRTSDYGIWRHAGGRNYTAVSEAFILLTSAPNPPVPGFPRGVQRITQTIQVNGDKFNSTAITQFFDVNGNLAFTACADAAADRMQ